MLHLSTLGSLDLRGADGHELRSVLVQPKRLALLVYLVLATPRGFHRRDRLLAVFWPELDAAHARNSLSQALRVLRRGLGDDVLVNRGDEEIGLAAGVLECDALAFEAALEQGRPAEALELYRGDLLAGFHLADSAPEFERWLEEERARLRERALDAALGLVEEAERDGNLALALQWARRAVGLAPNDERALGAKLKLLERQGDRAGALTAFDDFARRLEEELQLEPSAGLRALAEGIRTRSVDPAPASLEPSAPSRARPPAMAETGLPPPDESPVAVLDPPASPRLSLRLGARVEDWPRAVTIGLLALLMFAGVAALVLRSDAFARKGAHVEVAESSIAVLPFANLSADEENEYLASGLQDEILTQLAKIRTLRVISRTSVMRYAGTRQPAGEIADELGVASLLTGNVQRAGDRIRVNVHLVDARADRTLWAEHYDRDLGDLLAIQSEIAQAIAASLQAEITPSERASLARPPTRNQRAYDLYLQAGEYLRRPWVTEEEARAAERLYGRALELDPEFALAHARLADLHGAFHWRGWDRTPARREAWHRQLELALRLQPELPEAHRAQAHYFFLTQHDYPRAREGLEKALAGLPNDAQMHESLAAINCRQGRWSECEAGLRRAMQLDPRNAHIPSHLAFIIWFQRRYPEAVRSYDRALELAPDHHAAALLRGRVFVDWLGTTDSLAAAVRRLPPEWDPEGVATMHRVMLARLERRPLDALATIEASRKPGYDYMSYELPFALLRAEVYAEAGDGDRARAAYAEALAVLEKLATERPDAPPMRHAIRGWAYAGLGRKEEALRETSRAKELLPVSRDAVDGPAVLEFSAMNLTRIGETDAALRELEQLLILPSPLSVERLRRDPRWDVLRHDPRFGQLLEGTRLDGTPMRR